MRGGTWREGGRRSGGLPGRVAVAGGLEEGRQSHMRRYGRLQRPPHHSYPLHIRGRGVRLTVLVGEYDVNNSDSEGIQVSHVTQHPDFNRFTYDNDIAVLRLAESIPENLYRPACLPELDDDNRLEGVEAIVSGWGSTIEKGPPSSIPMKAQVNIWAQEECSGAGYGRRKVTPRMLCANAPERDSCTGDSGGPLLLPRPHYTIVGIVSWGRGCARQGYPGVYARVAKFLPWLKLALRHACTCQPPHYH
ncbi:unnamed protein product, partial [Iphiclides podalirius]